MRQERIRFTSMAMKDGRTVGVGKCDMGYALRFERTTEPFEGERPEDVEPLRSVEQDGKIVSVLGITPEAAELLWMLLGITLSEVEVDVKEAAQS